MKILGIETSCDETAAAVVEDGAEILSNVVVSQIDIFKEYGGVIPEVAARSHLEAMMPVVNKALSDAGCGWDEIDAIAVTHAPGLLGSLLIGTLTARTLAILHNKPLYAVHHLKSHVYANWLDASKGKSEPIFSSSGLEFSSTSYAGQPAEPSLRDEPVCLRQFASQGASGDVRNIRVKNSNHGMIQKKQVPDFPLLALVVSGGHTQILYMKAHNQFEIIGTTRDDAVGECFDKVAKILGLPYPGGPSITAMAKGQNILLGHTQGRSSRARPRPKGRSAEPMVLEGHSNLLPGDATKYKFPHPKVEGLDFSFSGLKTAVLREVQKELRLPISHPSYDLKNHLTEQQVADFAASFQKTAVDILVEKLRMALEQYPDVKSVVVAGGVSANELLRERVLSECLDSGHTPGRSPKSMVPNQDISATRHHECFFPAPSLSGDNGAMVAAAAYFEIQSGVEPTDPYSLNIYPRISIEI